MTEKPSQDKLYSRRDFNLFAAASMALGLTNCVTHSFYINGPKGKTKKYILDRKVRKSHITEMPDGTFYRFAWTTESEYQLLELSRRTTNPHIFLHAHNQNSQDALTLISMNHSPGNEERLPDFGTGLFTNPKYKLEKPTKLTEYIVRPTVFGIGDLELELPAVSDLVNHVKGAYAFKRHGIAYDSKLVTPTGIAEFGVSPTLYRQVLRAEFPEKLDVFEAYRYNSMTHRSPMAGADVGQDLREQFNLKNLPLDAIVLKLESHRPRHATKK